MIYLESQVSTCSILTVHQSKGHKGEGWGHPCHMSNIRNGNVFLLNLRIPLCAPSNFKKPRVTMSILKKVRCRMLIWPKKGHVAVSILGVFTHLLL